MADRHRSSAKEVSEFERVIEAAKVPPTLYLPTYRRIELEFGRMFEQIPGDVRRVYAAELDASRIGQSTDFIVELVRFGMEDISNTISSFEQQTRQYASNRFNRMMTSYLKEMANAKSLSVRDLRDLNIDQSLVATVLSRIEEGLLSEAEKNQITDIIVELSSGHAPGNPPFNKKWLAQFFVRLLEVHRDIVSRETPISSLVASLSKYFLPKKVSYDIENYHFSIKGPDDAELSMADLSSGEKQLLSILAYLSFSSQQSVNVFIDEPELSLSVPWQSDFLPDIVNTPTCNQLFAVTHSPFIYENRLGRTVVDFVEFGDK
jgi:hypothetical protein